VTIRGATVVSSENRHEWGYTFLTKVGAGWRLELKNPKDRVLVTCAVDGNKASCVASNRK